jgi:hypothetical protein
MTFARFNSRNVRSTANGALCGNFDQPLDHDALHRCVPSVFAEGGHASRSERYGYIPTINMVRGLEREGFRPVFACEAKARNEDKTGFTKHMVRFRRADVARSKLGAVPEVLLLNSHDGSSAYKLMAGVFRFVCANGLICGDTYQSVSVAHRARRNLVEDVIEGAYTVVNDFNRSLDTAEAMQGRLLPAPAQEAFAEAALAVRFDVDDVKDAPLQPMQVLQARRWEDAGVAGNQRDLWRTFNVIQENIVRGGLSGRTVNAEGQVRNTTTREVKGIDGNVRLNRALWTLAERMAELTK